MRLLATLSLCLVLTLPAQAQLAYDQPQARFLNYVQQTYGVGLVNCSITNQNDSNLASEITFPAGTPTNTQNAIIADAQTNYAVWGGWTPLPVPDYSGFKHDVLTNPQAVQYPYALLCATLVSDPSLSYNDRKTLASACAVWLTAAYPSQATAIINQLLTYANNRHLPLQ